MRLRPLPVPLSWRPVSLPGPSEEDVQELSALAFGVPDRRLFVTTHNQRAQGAAIPSAFRFDNLDPNDGVFLGFIGYRNFVIDSI